MLSNAAETGLLAIAFATGLAVVMAVTMALYRAERSAQTRRRARDVQHARDATAALAADAHDSAAAERARRYTAQIPADPHHRPGHDASVHGWDGMTPLAFGFTRPADAIHAGSPAPRDAERLTAAHAAAQAEADRAAHQTPLDAQIIADAIGHLPPTPEHPPLDPATIAHMQRGDHLVWQPPVYTPLPARGAADEITPALERRLRQMMRDEITRARAREMGGG